jgi:hypothetical protein
MITEDYCSDEVSKLLKEKGFDWDCIACYTTNGELRDIIHNTTGEVEECDWNNVPQTYLKIIGLASWYGNTSAPTHQMAMKWLREVHNIIIVIEPHSYNPIKEKTSSYNFSIWCGDNYEHPFTTNYPSYEDAVEAALKYCLTELI